MRLVFASNNQHKISEVREILSHFGFDVISMADAGFGGLEIEEGTESFESNARIKAEFLYHRTHGAVIADDSGLEVDALEGAPGVCSARYAGEPADDGRNNDLLLYNLQPFATMQERTARFRCVLTLIVPSPGGPKYFTARGDVEGHIGFEPRGEHGFGYDPLFVMEDGRTMAELSEHEKNAVSHRFRALNQLVSKLHAEGIGLDDRS